MVSNRFLNKKKMLLLFYQTTRQKARYWHLKKYENICYSLKTTCTHTADKNKEFKINSHVSACVFLLIINDYGFPTVILCHSFKPRIIKCSFQLGLHCHRYRNNFFYKLQQEHYAFLLTL